MERVRIRSGEQRPCTSSVKVSDDSDVDPITDPALSHSQSIFPSIILLDVADGERVKLRGK